MRICSRIYSNCQIIVVFDRVQSEMGVRLFGYKKKKKIKKGTMRGNYCIIKKNYVIEK